MKKSIFFLSKSVTALGILFLISTVSVFGQDVQSETRKALRLIDIDQKTKAVEAMDKVVATYPTDAAALYYMGYTYIKTNALDKALVSFEKGIQLNEKEQLNYVGKGYVKFLQNNLTEAKTLFDKALKDSKSKNADVLNGIAEAYLTNKQYTNQALELLLKSKSADKKNAKTFILLGDAYLQLNNGGQSVSSYEDAALIDPKDAKPHYKIGQVYARSKNVTASTEAFKKAISVDPDYTLAYKELGEIYYFAKEGVNAVQAQEKYLALTENPAAGQLQYAFYLIMAKNYTKANEIFKVVIQLPEVLPITYRFYGISLMEVNDYQQAHMVFGKYFEKAKPEEILASDYNYDGKALLGLKQDSLALISLGKSLAIDSTQLDIRQLQAETLYKDKKYGEAAKSYEKLISMRSKPLSQDYYSTGRSYYYNSQFVEADSAFSRLAKLQPTLTIGYLWKARSIASQDPELEKGLAKPYFDKVVEVGLADPVKNKADLVEAYQYLASYSYNLAHDITATKTYYQKILALKPDDPTSKQNLELLKKIEQKKKP